MELDAKTQLRRFCYLGSLEPIHVHRRGSVNVTEYWPKLQELCKALDDVSFVLILKEALQETTLVRRDEPLFVYAVYLTADVDIKWKTVLRKAFPTLIQSDNDLFLYCKYAMLIQKEEKHKGFSKTTRKAITAWYEQQSTETLHSMWATQRGAHGFTHKALIKLCHITDETLKAVGAVTPFFKTCTELLKAAELGEHAVANKAVVCTTENTTTAPTNHNDAAPEMETDSEVATSSTAARTQQGENLVNGMDEMNSATESIGKVEKSKSNTELSPSFIVSMSKLRTTNNKMEALKIIRKFKLRYHQVPNHLLRFTSIMEALIPTMSYLQLLKSWRTMVRYNHFENQKILKLCQSLLDNKKMLHKGNIHPIVFLLQMHELGIRGDLKKLSPKKVHVYQMPYFKQLYAQSFGQNQGTGLRMLITINLQTSYKKKLLKNHKKLYYYDAAVALAFGYFKKESQVEVYHWTDESTKLEQIPWTKDMDIKAAIACCDKIQSVKNTQRLITPVIQFLSRKQVFDVFLSIVPTAGRGNPGQKSEFLCKVLDKYREAKNSRAKYVIVDLLKFRRSMHYSTARNENILEICGLDEHTTNLITNFVLNRFG